MASAPATSNATNRQPLTKTAIVAAATAIADADGVSKLSMRNLARELGFEVMSLYNHVANKNELLGAMVDSIAAEIDLSPSSEAAGDAADSNSMAAIRALAISSHDMFMRHRWAPDLWLKHMPGPERIRTMEALLSLLATSGLSEELAHVGFHAVNNHVLGHAMQVIGMTLDSGNIETRAADFLSGLSSDDHHHMIIHVHQHLDGDDGNSFEFVLDLILDGLVRKNT